MYHPKGISIKTEERKKLIFVGVLKVTEEKNRIRGSASRSVPKCHGSRTLIYRDLFHKKIFV
jgi:hypothetical protein